MNEPKAPGTGRLRNFRMATKPQQTAQETGAAFSLDTAAVLAEESTGEIAGRSPWYLA